MKDRNTLTSKIDKYQMEKDSNIPEYAKNGTATKWYRGWDLTEEEREVFRVRSRESQLARIRADKGIGPESVHPIYTPNFDPSHLMKKLPGDGLTSLSLFSGGGGLDLGFDNAGFQHVASYDILPFAGETLRSNRPQWTVNTGEKGDVTNIEWDNYGGLVDVLHGGPPCQPFSTAGRQKGSQDIRDMFPEFVRAVLTIRPRAFVAENVSGLTSRKFEDYLSTVILNPLSKYYNISMFRLEAAWFGIPQRRARLIFVGFLSKDIAEIYKRPSPTHYFEGGDRRQTDLLDNLATQSLHKTMGVREALGLPDIGFDSLAPILRSSLTGPRHTTSILSSTAANRVWKQLCIWPNGVSMTREKAQVYPAKYDHYRLSVPEVALIQGFPESWTFSGATYQKLGLIGNSVAPPMGYQIAQSIALALLT